MGFIQPQEIIAEMVGLPCLTCRGRGWDMQTGQDCEWCAGSGKRIDRGELFSAAERIAHDPELVEA